MKKVALLLASASLLTACHPDNPPLSAVTKPVQPAAVEKPGPLNFEKTFGYFKSQSTAEQQKHNENTISVFFTAKQPNGQALEGLTVPDVVVTENRTNVSPFTLETINRKEDQKPVEIALVIDVTGTMVPLIEEAKLRLKEFVESDKAKNLNLRLCVATFGDRTVKRCNRFFEINSGRNGEPQRRSFLNELAAVRAGTRENDPGFPSLDENPMGAVVDMAQSPWGADALHFVILVTDWGFLYSPDNQQNIGSRAPTMKQVNEAIARKNMKIFAITRTEHTHTITSKLEKNCTWVDQASRSQHCVWDGFNTPFQGEPGIVQASGGEHFNFDQVRTGVIKFESILDKIVRNVSVTYKLTYVVEQVQGLNPTLPKEGRDIQLGLRDPNRGTLQKSAVESSVPTGRPEYKQEFTLSDNAISNDGLQVTMQGQPVNPNEFSINGGKIRFKSVPPPGVKMTFDYFFENPDLNLKLEPIRMRGGLNANNTRVWLNDSETSPGDILFNPDASGNTSVSLNNTALSAPQYKIRERKEVKVKIVSNAAP